MAVRRRRARRGGFSNGRKFVWARHRAGGTFTGDGTAVNALAGFEADYGANLIGATITRIRGTIVAAPATSINGGARIAARVRNQAAAAVLPDEGPYDNEHADWMMWETFQSNTVIDTDSVSNRVIDVRSQRKLEEIDESFWIFHQGTPSVPAAVWNFSYDLSIGLKLP